ncbi:alpha/beta fold hydrolase [Nocardia sp. NPDC056000]|uniref:alpha/beta fold hydrolase n=1 Tax=Nocardia sp. NPDC056000 TaxID=3345674 RepID=UPI0035E0B137
MTSPEAVRVWREGGRLVPTSVGQVFVRTGSGTGPAVLLLHGYPSSSYDFSRIVDDLGGRSWIALDFPGFGLSDKPRPHRYSLFEHADIVEEVLATLESGPVVVLAHDMGTSVLTELLARDIEGALLFSMERAVLGNGSVILERASLRPIQQILRGPLGPIAARLANRPVFTREFAQLFSAQHPLTAQEAAAQWALLSSARGHRIAHLLTAYLDERVTYAERWHGAVRDWQGTLGFLWATGDPVATTAVLDGLRALRPGGAVIELPGLGHYPQIEDPAAYAAGARRLLGIDPE